MTVQCCKIGPSNLRPDWAAGLLTLLLGERCLSRSVCLSVCVCLCLSVCLSVSVSVCRSVCLSVWLSVWSVCLFVCLSVWSSAVLNKRARNSIAHPRYLRNVQLGF